jgi:hypothetical protein
LSARLRASVGVHTLPACRSSYTLLFALNLLEMRADFRFS